MNNALLWIKTTERLKHPPYKWITAFRSIYENYHFEIIDRFLPGDYMSGYTLTVTKVDTMERLVQVSYHGLGKAKKRAWKILSKYHPEIKNFPWKTSEDYTYEELL